jgi:Fic family protein
MEKTVTSINTTHHPLEKALIALAMIAYIQPFSDGNKRTARMLANALLLAHDYFPLSYRSIDENEYKQALILFYETNNLFHLKRLFLDQYTFALKTYFVA